MRRRKAGAAVLLAVLACAGAFGDALTIGQPVAPVSAPDTYTLGGTADVAYTTVSAPAVSGGTRDLMARVYWPAGADPRRPRALVILVGTNGWLNSFYTIFGTEAGYAVGSGCVAAVIETRVRPDDPYSLGDASSHSALRRTVRADEQDLEAAIAYFTGEGRVTEDYAIEPGWIIAGGVSSGGVTALGHQQAWNQVRPLAGIIVSSAAFGGDGFEVSGETATDVLRTQLGRVEGNLTVPTCAFLWELDSVLGPGWVGALVTRLSSVPLSVAHVVDDEDDHTLWSGFPDEELEDAATMEEAWVEFIAAVCAATPASAGGVRVE